ncbi:hypothetical protein JCM18899A_21010 [Nocardioides sp. AN3]
MKLVDCLDLGAALVPAAPCLVTENATLSYAEVQGLSRSVAASLGACGAGGATVGIVSANDPMALTCLFGASRAGAAWVLVDPAQVGADELVEELSACSVLLFHAADAGLVLEAQLRLPRAHTLVCLDGRLAGALLEGARGKRALGWGEFLAGGMTRTAFMPVGPSPIASSDVRASDERPVFLAVGPLSEETASQWQPVLAQGGRIVMRTPEPALAAESRLEA